MPSFDIFRVCEQIHAEAEGANLSQNLFVMPMVFRMAEPIAPPNFEHPTTRGRHLFSRKGWQSIKNISIAFENRSYYQLTMIKETWRLRRERGDLDYESLTPAERLDVAHQRSIRMVDMEWEEVEEA